MLCIFFILLRLSQQPRIIRNSRLHSDCQPLKPLVKWATSSFSLSLLSLLTPKEMSKDDFLEEVHTFLLLPASDVQVLFCSWFSFPKQISSLLLIVARRIHCLYKGGLVKAIDATFCLFRLFWSSLFFYLL